MSVVNLNQHLIFVLKIKKLQQYKKTHAFKKSGLVIPNCKHFLSEVTGHTCTKRHFRTKGHFCIKTLLYGELFLQEIRKEEEKMQEGKKKIKIKISHRPRVWGNINYKNEKLKKEKKIADRG